ncbi:MAG: DivIVA domain-containing protein [Bacilli bacterium]|nr:DivIVA domain-containing protein [Bacilli bacterium]
MEQFSSETNGYNRKEVNKFLSDIIKETDEIIEKYKQQEEQMKSLQEQIDHYQGVQSTIKDAVVEEESNHIIMEAKREASEIINDALERAEQVEAQRRLLEKNMEIFKKKLKLIMEQQHIIVDKIDELEIQDK